MLTVAGVLAGELLGLLFSASIGTVVPVFGAVDPIVIGSVQATGTSGATPRANGSASQSSLNAASGQGVAREG